MPEGTSAVVFEQRVDQTIKAFSKKHARRPKAHIKIFPRCFSEGTSEKSYCTASIRNKGWHSELEPFLPEDSINKFDRSRSLKPKGVKADWFYLIEHSLDDGELFVTSRGKEMVIACGYHATLINFGLEACFMKILQSDLYEILSQDIPGPSEDPRKAQRLRSFVVPPRMIEAYSSTTEDRHMEIFLAVLLENGEAFILTDFSHLVRMTFISKDCHWTEADFEIKSPRWLTLWGSGRGPCWHVERDDAVSALDKWRSDVLHASASKQSRRVVDTISNDNLYFNGFGAHMANDALHSIGMHPLAPLWYICEDDDLFAEFKAGLCSYYDLLLQKSFIQRVAANTNSSNPLAYNKCSATVFIQSFVKVYRKQPAYIPFDHWWSMHSRGFFDRNHTIGSPYVPNFSERKEYKKMDIFLLEKNRQSSNATLALLQSFPRSGTEEHILFHGQSMSILLAIRLPLELQSILIRKRTCLI
ncbi:hypothetical protein SCHPADRAFT_864352 [Schizopora paradoxa]|uniref:Uncharacterized protein n=1 Tax=Schizopora paradoxa TaxID=27342 RepID=A0A0H2S672_9AGAM|nr:hypothetical protein SCHPADRAFT_864352 [Schizopora paradoxa]